MTKPTYYLKSTRHHMSLMDAVAYSCPDPFIIRHDASDCTYSVYVLATTPIQHRQRPFTVRRSDHVYIAQR